MFARLVLSTILIPKLIHGQPGPPERPFHVVVQLDHALFRNGVPQYMVIAPDADTLIADRIRPATGDSVLSFLVWSSTPDRPWTMKYLPGGAMMDIHLHHEPSILGISLRLPFTPGAFELDSRRLMKCLSDQAADLRARDALRPAQDKEHPFRTMDTLACHGGLLVYSHGGGMHTEVRIPDLRPFVKRVPRTPPTEARNASYPGGMDNFDRFIHTHFSKPLIERVNERVKLSALVTIESDGSIHRVDLNGSAYPELDREYERVLQLSNWWEPAAAPNAQINNDAPAFWFTEESKVIEFSVEPDSIWDEIPDEWLVIGPQSLTSTDSLTIQLQWMGASCGSYVATTEVLPRKAGDEFREVILRFGATVQPMCTDGAHQYFTHTMAPLPAGSYRLRRLAHAHLPEGGSWPPDPYRVKYFEVRP